MGLHHCYQTLPFPSQQFNHQLAMVDLDPRQTLHGCNLLDNAGAYCPDVEGCRCSGMTFITSLAAGIVVYASWWVNVLLSRA
jgi:hypothetical protein